jgi:N-methylhydantoinase B
MGAGEFRGGAGYKWVLRNGGNRAGVASGQSDGDVMVGRGVQGGHDSPRSETYLLRGNSQIPIPSKRLVWAEAGDRLVMQTGGGAGVGKPHRRDPMRVVRDVQYGLVSLDAARNIYRVAINRETGKLDTQETIRLREDVP